MYHYFPKFQKQKHSDAKCGSIIIFFFLDAFLNAIGTEIEHELNVNHPKIYFFKSPNYTPKVSEYKI